MATDNSNDKVAEDALRDQQTLLQTMIDAVPVPIYFKDPDGVYLSCNKAFAKFTGLPIDEVVGKTVYDVTSAAFADKNDSSDKNLLKKGGTIVFEAAVKAPDGSLRDIVFHKAVHTRSDGTTTGIAGSMLDVTDRKETQKLLRHMANHDSLTGVPNRNLGKDRLITALARAKRN
jgi:PAS domain S-box-containing protein